jgi:hypothetical protein
VGQSTNSSIRFTITVGSWKRAARDHVDGTEVLLYSTSLYGFLEAVFGSVIVLQDDFASIPSVAWQLAKLRSSGFPSLSQRDCLVDDIEGGWSLGFSMDPTTNLVTVKGSHLLATAEVPSGVAIDAIDAFLSEFSAALSQHVPDVGWGDLEILRPYAMR